MYFKTGKEAPQPTIMGKPNEENSFLLPHYWGVEGDARRFLKYIFKLLQGITAFQFAHVTKIYGTLLGKKCDIISFHAF